MDTAPPLPFADIVHASVSEDPADLIGRRSGARTLFVFWSGDRPAGQLVVGPDGDPTSAVRNYLATLSSPSEPAPTTPPPGTASVVICTRDRPAELERCLASLPRQSRHPDEVIVVDNASKGGETREITLAAGVRYVREDRPGLDIARNTGLVAANSEVVAFTDDDTELHPRWLEQLVAAFDAEHVLAATGLVLPAELKTEAQWIFETQWGFGRGFARTDFGPTFYRLTRDQGCPAWQVGAGANMAFRRSVVNEVGLFDPRLDVGAAGCSGDSEYWYRIIARGWTCRYEPGAVVYHYHRMDMPALASQIFYYMRGHVAALLVQYERTGDYGNIRRAFLYLPDFYLRRVARRIVRGRQADSRLLLREIAGATAGLWFYMGTKVRAGRAG